MLYIIRWVGLWFSPIHFFITTPFHGKQYTNVHCKHACLNEKDNEENSNYGIARLCKCRFQHGKRTEQEREETEKANRQKGKNNGGVKISGTENTMYRFAKCCSPLPGDEIRGYVTRGRGIAIHRSDCQNFISLMEKEPEREIDVYWDESAMSANTTYEFNFTIKASDRNGLLLDIIRILNEYKMNLLNVNTNTFKENGNKRILIHLRITIRSREDFDRLANNLKSMSEVIDIIKK